VTSRPDRVSDRGPEVRTFAIGVSAQSEFDRFIIPRMGMRFPQQLPYEKWLDIGRELAAVSTSSAWCLGDWLLHGEHAYSGRYREAIERTSLDYQTLRNYAWVARRFPPSRRRDTLSFAHHTEVAGLPQHEQDFWLRKAEEFSWSRNRLRQEVRHSLAERATADDSDEARADLGEETAGGMETAGTAATTSIAAAPSLQPGPAAARIQVRLSPEQLESCQAAASMLGHSIEEWAVSALDRAARAELAAIQRRRLPALFVQCSRSPGRSMAFAMRTGCCRGRFEGPGRVQDENAPRAASNGGRGPIGSKRLCRSAVR
jgi:hypothetical protein